MITQVLRTIDKHDKIGTEGVVALLQKPPAEFGASLDPVTAGLVGQFLSIKGATNEETLDRLRSFFTHAGRVSSRLRLMAELERAETALGVTKWDELLDMPPNGNQTWDNGGRPENIGWALDDILDVAARMAAKQ
jgi:hypothetical protein